MKADQPSREKRMTIYLSKELADKLEQLSYGLGISKVEALRRAIATEAYLRKEIDNGGTLLIKNGSNIKEIVLLR
jgi:Ribbon-helix-helix protein, copG family